ncbi:hypothetical protein [Actinoallomurus iriomotensis]|uniref:Uncharacterized protein n=1 Tax=Actinoallomurus iriomotensis TaxID=478107 RepID=A0A9W6W568_9ACTN|nr:hypothetical protein [Actinoallomurus iriomotensis]GLY90667.1 hypothetical protein Airi02_085960 [Actinoallomurus iriomotensis]
MTRRGPYGYDSGRRERARAYALDHRERVPRHVAALIALTAVAVVIIGWDYEARSRTLDWTRPSAGVTAPPSPHPVTSSSHPHQ